jgi:uncharacterized protein (DUF433 family)
MTPLSTEHIEATPGVCGGRPRVAGTRIRVMDIVIWTEQGLSPDEIVSGYPHLKLADVYAALAYYFDHREEIDRDMREDDKFVAQMMAEHASKRTALPGTDANADPVPS